MKIPNLQNITLKSDSINYRIPVIIFAAAFIVRLIILINFSKSPSFYVPIIDEDNYNNLARSLAAGENIDRSFFWQPFFYPFLLSIIYYLTGSSIFAAKFIQIIIGSMTCLIIYFLAEEIFDKKTGIIAGMTASLYAPVIFFETMLLSEGTAAFFSALLLFILLKIKKSQNVILLLLFGIISGLSIITRPTFLPFIFIAYCWLFFVFLKDKMAKKLIINNGFILLFGLFVILFPVSLKNFFLTGNFTFLPHSGPINFFIGNNPQADKTIQLRPGSDWDNLVSMAKNDGARNLQEEKHYYSKLVVNYMLSDPADFIKGLFKKSLQLISSREIPRTTDVYIFRKYSGLFSMLVWKAGKFGFPFGLLLPLAVIGVFFNHKKIPLYFYFLTASYSLSIILVFISSRQRLPVIPPLIVIAAAGSAALIGNIKADMQNKKWLKLSAMVLLIIFIFGIISLPGPFASEKFNYESEMFTNAATSSLGKGNVAESLNYLNKALTLNPQNHVAYRLLGLIYLIQNNYKESEHYFKKAISIDPQYAEAYYDYGNLYYLLKNYDEALIKFRETARLSPGFFEAHINAGSIYFLKRDFNEAIFHFEKALVIKPSNDLAHKKIGDAFIETGNFEKAIFHFNEAFKISNDADTAYMLANLFFQNNQATYNIQESKKWAETACELSGNNNGEYLFMLAIIYFKTDQKESAFDYAEKALISAGSSQDKELAVEIKDFINKNKLL